MPGLAWIESVKAKLELKVQASTSASSGLMFRNTCALNSGVFSMPSLGYLT